MRYVLVVSSNDADDVVQPIIQQLRERDFECFTYQQKLKFARLGSAILKELEKMVETASSVLVFSSPNLPQDRYALALIKYASYQGNLAPIVLGEKPITLNLDLFSPPEFLILKPEPYVQINQILSALSLPSYPHF